ncbi:MAG: hypothetical protein QNJ55_28175 [Xenococcus sp. MO_188.B8]|nr:hypothetical protein [Xenococcus sp. MO_188.B8]
MRLSQLTKEIDNALLEIQYSLIVKSRRQQIPLIQEIERLRENKRYQNPKSLIPFGYKIYSQSDEDGIIHEIFQRIGVTNRIFIEFGIGNGLENNSLALLFADWQGLWIDASERSLQKIRKYWHHIITKGQLKVVQAFITTNNINQLIDSQIDSSEVDLLSVDIDGNDYHIVNAITCIRPRVLVIEYNAKFRPPALFCLDYDATHTWKKDDCFGASLKFLEVNLAQKGYCLVGCNLAGVNAFFVRQDLVQDHFLSPFTAENHYEPARYYLSGYQAGHRASYQTLAKSLTMRS